LTLSLNGQEDQNLEFPLPQVNQGDTFNFTNSVGMSFEAAHAQKQLRDGKIESDIISLEESLVIMKIMDEARRQIGFKYSFEK